jgi:hypothetical protein
MRLTKDFTQVLRSQSVESNLISAHNREIKVTSERMAALRKAAKPLTGPCYWIPTPYGWDVIGYPEQGYGEVEHPQVWRRSVVPMLVDHWNLTDMEAMELARCPYGVPRCRVSKGHQEDSYYVLHGNDAPFPLDEAISKVAKEMNLTGLLLNGLLKVEFEAHEQQTEDQTATVSRILDQARARKKGRQ